jgi:hypothetical protein
MDRDAHNGGRDRALYCGRDFLLGRRGVLREGVGEGVATHPYQPVGVGLQLRRRLAGFARAAQRRRHGPGNRADPALTRLSAQLTLSHASNRQEMGRVGVS